MGLQWLVIIQMKEWFSMRKMILLILLCLPLCSVASQTPKATKADKRMKTVFFEENNVVEIIGQPLVKTSIEFEMDEKIIDVSLGDSSSWSVDTSSGRSNLLFLKPISEKSDTNMAVVTDQRQYEFHLRSDPSIKEGTYRVKFSYKEKSKPKISEKILSTLSRNFDYSYTGKTQFVPVEVFDDGESFTYFKFSKNQVRPAIYSVDTDREEALVNYRVEGDYLVVEKITGQFSFRSGDLVTTVVNNKLIRELRRG